jgi:mannose-6-phosphate isomerase-like protein (cupin superfamily)
MTDFATAHRPKDPTVVAPDGSDVRVLLALPRGSMAEFELAAGRVSAAVAHRTVEEIWCVLSGRGQMWRRQGSREEVVALEPGVCLTIPQGTHFQFRALTDGALRVLGVTMPPWPGGDEALLVPGPWTPTATPSAR